jgi:hypothetical protein
MTQEQVEKLLQPRYKLIADYPSNIDDIGTVYEIDLSDGHGIDFEMTCKKYPNLFRELEWYEERKANELPNYLKFNEDRMSTSRIGDDIEPEYHKVKKHQSTSMDSHWRYGSYKNFISEWHNTSYCYGAFVPATEQDYLTYKQNQLTV